MLRFFGVLASSRLYYFIAEKCNPPVGVRERFRYTKHIALENFESKNIFLEGTGSMVFDRENKLVFACRSPRTDESILQEFCKATSFRPIVFDSFDSNGDAIYHTNVMMAMGHDFAVICLSSIRDDEQRYDVISNQTLQEMRMFL